MRTSSLLCTALSSMLLGAALAAAPASAPQGCTTLDVEGSIVADNYYGFYTANSECSDMVLTQRGQGCSNWTPDSYSFSTNDRFLYIVAYSDDWVAQGLLHDLTVNGETVFSGDARWQVAATGIDLDDCADLPPTGDIVAEIQKACSSGAWTDAVTAGPLNDPAGTGYIFNYHSTIDENAQWTWYDSGTQTSSLAPFQGGWNHDEYLIFRLEISQVHGRMTADNYHVVYTEDADGNLTWRGMGCTWGSPVDYCFTTADENLIVVAWSDKAAAQGLLGDLQINAGSSYTGTSGWQVYPAGIPLVGCVSPAPFVIEAAIAGALWVTPTVGGSNLSAIPWGTVPGISASASWIWHDSGAQVSTNAPFSPGFDHGEAMIFRHRLQEPCCVARCTEPMLTISELGGGHTAQFCVRCATPNSPVYFAYSLVGTGLGSATSVGGCPTFYPDLLPPASILGTAIADAAGEACISVPVPPSAFGLDIWFQAFDLGSCSLSNVVAATVF